jgi:hypothetical protein
MKKQTNATMTDEQVKNLVNRRTLVSEIANALKPEPDPILNKHDVAAFKFPQNVEDLAKIVKCFPHDMRCSIRNGWIVIQES